MSAGRSLFSKVAPYAGKIALAGTILKVGFAAKDAYAVASSTDTRERKATQFAGIAGSLAGGFAGAKIGALVGAFGGPIGAAVGGVIGGAIGTFAGDKALSAIARKVFEHKPGEPPASAEAVAKAAAAAGEGAPPRAGPRVEQTNTFAPVFHVRVESNEADAAEKFLARVSPMLTQMMAEQQRKTTNFSAMFDAPHM